MVTDFNGFDKGVIGKKLPADRTLNNMKKADLIELLHIAEHNHSTLAWFYKNACDNSKCHRCPLSLSYDKVVNYIDKQISALYEDSENGAEDDAVLGWNRALDKIREIMKEGGKV